MKIPLSFMMRSTDPTVDKFLTAPLRYDVLDHQVGLRIWAIKYEIMKTVNQQVKECNDRT